MRKDTLDIVFGLRKAIGFVAEIFLSVFLNAAMKLFVSDLFVLHHLAES